MKDALKIVLLAALTAGLPAQEADTGTEASIRALEKEWTVGQSRNDSRILNLVFDDALFYVEYGQLVSKAEYLSRIGKQPPSQSQITMEPMKVVKFENTALVLGTYVERQNTAGKFTTQRWKFIDTWVYKKNGWVLVAAGATPVADR